MFSSISGAIRRFEPPGNTDTSFLPDSEVFSGLAVPANSKKPCHAVESVDSVLIMIFLVSTATSLKYLF
ncbi:hypothetical protein ACH42_14335 [Endozoicomonas sp. (ex Bugula neritina AB1)]|nr:hypothetical protein ACH42_14335 [Endozoicomonas sp. (ex Bugula neritina AB1)]